MPRVNANNIEIEYETFGDPSSKPLILINGFSSQMIRWEVDFCKQLVEREFYVVRFDNRDVGFSSKLDNLGRANVSKVMKAVQTGESVEVPYALEDMADDVIGLLDALKIKKAHICGMSMGAAITQIIGFRHPSRVLSLVTIMGSTGAPNLPPPTPEAMDGLLNPVPTEREAFIEDSINRRRVLNGPHFPYSEEKERRLAALTFDRGYHIPGIARQLVAIYANGNRKPKLASITAPTLVIHGAIDPLVRVEGGKDTVDGIPGAELMIIEGMGHNIPPEVWTQVIDAIAKNAAKV